MKSREAILQAMEKIMGPVPEDGRIPPLDLRIHNSEFLDSYQRSLVTFQTELNDPRGLCRIHAWLLVPHRLTSPAPAALCLHQTTRSGKDQPVGLSTMSYDTPDLQYAHELALRGFVTLSPDYPGFGNAWPIVSARGYVSGTMKGIWNHMLAIDLLQTLPEVDAKRIAAVGHSLGGHNALFLAAFDERIRAVLTSCGFSSFHHYHGGELSGWSQDTLMPRIATVCRNRAENMPFDFFDVLAAIAPRPVLINAPQDDIFHHGGVAECIAAALPVYAGFGAASNLVLESPDCAHAFPDEVRERLFSRLSDLLKVNRC